MRIDSGQAGETLFSFAHGPWENDAAYMHKRVNRLHSTHPMNIRQDDLHSPQVLQLLQLHLDTMAPTAPPASRHALDLNGLRDPAVTFWCVWDDQTLAGFGALKQLSPRAGEIKAMRTAPDYLRRGVAQMLLAHIEQEACERGYETLFLETGSMAFFDAARQLYRGHGFEPCPPFASYREDPNSVFMRKELLGCA